MSQTPSPEAAANSAEATSAREFQQRPMASLKRRVMGGAMWSMMGFGAGQAMRMVSHLAVAYFLFPEALGVIAIAQICMQGLEMFSDAGLRGSIIQHARGDNPDFVNTAWTVQVLRGVTIWILATLLAWPFSLVFAKSPYADQTLFPVLLMVGSSSLITGLKSTKLYTYARRIAVGRLTLLELGTQATKVCITVVAVWQLQSIWALVIGWLAGAAVHTIASHVFLPGPTNRFRWCPEAARSLFKFGRWILISSATAFLASQGDRLLMGTFKSLGLLGLYSIAFYLSQVGVMGIRSLSERVLMPMYAESLRDQPEALAKRLYRARVAMMSVALPALWTLMIFGQQVVDLLYRGKHAAEYAQAGWMLQVLAAGAVIHCIEGMVSPVLLAAGNSFRLMVVLMIRTALLLTAVSVFALIGNFTGLVVAIAVVPWVAYIAVIVAVRKYGVWFWSLDLIRAGGNERCGCDCLDGHDLRGGGAAMSRLKKIVAKLSQAWHGVLRRAWLVNVELSAVHDPTATAEN